MLVIARRVGEMVRIGEDITITVREIQGKRVRLSVSAPAAVVITRAELGPGGPELGIEGIGCPAEESSVRGSDESGA